MVGSEGKPSAPQPPIREGKGNKHPGPATRRQSERERHAPAEDTGRGKDRAAKGKAPPVGRGLLKHTWAMQGAVIGNSSASGRTAPHLEAQSAVGMVDGISHSRIFLAAKQLWAAASARRDNYTRPLTYLSRWPAQAHALPHMQQGSSTPRRRKGLARPKALTRTWADIDMLRFPISNHYTMAPTFELLYAWANHARCSAEAAVRSVPQFYVLMISQCALPFNDTEGIRSPAGRAQWISSPCP